MATQRARPAGRRWDLFCRVVDNYGDVGVAWRLAADLAARGEAVRLCLDDGSALAWMAPQGAEGVEVLDWTVPPAQPGDVVVETFGCDPPPDFVARMAARRPPPVWIDLEYLSAEPYVERSHGLPSPVQHGPGRGLTKWFYFPGFTPATGGLLREPGLAAAREGFDRDAWCAVQGIERQAGERLVSLFCYDNPALPALLAALAERPTLLLLTPGPAQRALQIGTSPGLRLQALPWLTQAGYDRLLWACDLNFVRGEDSLVRAIWAGAPFVWQIYPQHDGVHARKLQAFLDRLLGCSSDPAFAGALRALWGGWNDLGPWPAAWPAEAAWRACCAGWRDRLLRQTDLAGGLQAFAAARG